jgi:ribosomal protein L37AE/L43A
MNAKTELPGATERLRVNMGWQCPECYGPNVKTPQRGRHVCTDCGCQWDRSYYSALIMKSQED